MTTQDSTHSNSNQNLASLQWQHALLPLRLLAIAGLALAVTATPARAQSVLQATLSAPAELHLGAHDAYRMTLRNGGSTAASNTTVRLPLPAGLNAMAPLPSGCSVTTDAFGTQTGVRQLRCVLASVPARATRSWSFVLQAPTMPMNVSHRMLASATNVAGSAWSNTVATRYDSFSIPIVPGLAWEMASCNNGTSGPLAWNLCPTSAEIVSEVVLAVGGVVDNAEGYTGAWLQTDPQSLRITWAAEALSPGAVQNYGVINSRCLRGPGETVPMQGNPKVYLASRICRL